MEKVTHIIKDKLSVVEVLKQYIELMPAGKSFKAKCPFHNEKTPSFVVSPERQSWHCFGCNEGGDIFTFVQKYENVEFFEALRILAEKAGVEIKRESVEQQRQFGVLYDINELATRFYTDNLKKNNKAQEYLKNRGLTGETAKTFRVGVASESWDELTAFLMGKGFNTKDLERSGLVIRNEKKGSYYDRFRDRIMFPIFNHSGKVVGFSGRILPGGDELMGKYINSPETPIFSKSKVLFGFYQARSFVRESNQVLVVEGQMDVLMAHQGGYKAVVATSGTALTDSHLLALSRLTDRVVFNFDSDEAGQRAAERALDMTLRSDLSVYLLRLEKYKDIAELVQAEPQNFIQSISKIMPIKNFYFDRYLDLTDSYSKKKGVKEILKKIVLIPSAIEREDWLDSLSRKVSIMPDALREEMKNFDKKEEVGVVEKRKQENNLSRLDNLSYQLVLGGVHFNNLDLVYSSKNYISKRYLDILEALRDGSKVSEEVKKQIDEIHFKSAMYNGGPIEAVSKELKIEWLKMRKNKLMEDIKKAESGSVEAMPSLIKEFQDVSSELERSLSLTE